MNRRVVGLLSDIISAGERILQFVGDSSYEEYVANSLLQSAVERQFEIIGEALSRLSRHAPNIFEAIPDGRRIIGFRNVLAHGYDIVDDEIVWEAIRVHLPQLLGTVRALLERETPL
jgi:uncharacterized protein with HEPN domain